MNLIDTHTHMFSSQFDEDREQIVKECIESGIETLLLPNDSSLLSGAHRRERREIVFGVQERRESVRV